MVRYFKMRRPFVMIISAVMGVAVGLLGMASFADGVVIKSKSILAQILLERAWERSLSHSSGGIISEGVMTFSDGTITREVHDKANYKSHSKSNYKSNGNGFEMASLIAKSPIIKPWPWADIWPVAKVEVPRLNQHSIVLSGVSGQALAFGPGLMAGSPEIGEAGLAIMAAHRDTHFRFLKNIKIGDEVVITDQRGIPHRFMIEETRIVDANASGLVMEAEPEDGRAKIALVTCWPFDAREQGSKRFVAIGSNSLK